MHLRWSSVIKKKKTCFSPYRLGWMDRWEEGTGHRPDANTKKQVRAPTRAARHRLQNESD